MVRDSRGRGSVAQNSVPVWAAHHQDLVLAGSLAAQPPHRGSVPVR